MIKNIQDLPLFITCAYIDMDGIQKTADIQTRGVIDRAQDAKIGNFYENWYIRPRKAVLKKEYKNITDYKKACSLSLKKNNIAQKILRYFYEDNGTIYNL